MKLIVKTEDNVVKYALSDDTSLGVEENKITVGDPPQFIIGDMGSSRATIYENVTDTPEDWAGDKYTYDGSAWSANEDWVDPTVDPEPDPAE